MSGSVLSFTQWGEKQNMCTSRLAEGDEKKFDVILAKFDQYFVPKRNVNHEQALFHQRNKRQGETVESFVRSLSRYAFLTYLNRLFCHESLRGVPSLLFIGRWLDLVYNCCNKV